MASLSTCHLELVVWDGNLVKSKSCCFANYALRTLTHNATSAAYEKAKMAAGNSDGFFAQQCALKFATTTYVSAVNVIVR